MWFKQKINIHFMQIMFLMFFRFVKFWWSRSTLLWITVYDFSLTSSFNNFNAACLHIVDDFLNCNWVIFFPLDLNSSIDFSSWTCLNFAIDPALTPKSWVKPIENESGLSTTLTCKWRTSRNPLRWRGIIHFVFQNW